MSKKDKSKSSYQLYNETLADARKWSAKEIRRELCKPEIAAFHDWYEDALHAALNEKERKGKK